MDTSTAIKRDKLGPSFNFRMHVSGEFAGEKFVIDEIVTCTPERLSGGIGGLSMISYGATRASFGLSFGRRGLFVSVVNVCGVVLDARGNAARSGADDFAPAGRYQWAPLIYSVDDYESPNAITAHLREIGESFGDFRLDAAYGDFTDLTKLQETSSPLLSEDIDPRYRRYNSGRFEAAIIYPTENGRDHLSVEPSLYVEDWSWDENGGKLHKFWEPFISGRVLMSPEPEWRMRFQHYFEARPVLDQSFEVRREGARLLVGRNAVRDIIFQPGSPSEAIRLNGNTVQIQWPDGTLNEYTAPTSDHWRTAIVHPIENKYYRIKFLPFPTMSRI